MYTVLYIYYIYGPRSDKTGLNDITRLSHNISFISTFIPGIIHIGLFVFMVECVKFLV